MDVGVGPGLRPGLMLEGIDLAVAKLAALRATTGSKTRSHTISDQGLREISSRMAS